MCEVATVLTVSRALKSVKRSRVGVSRSHHSTEPSAPGNERQTTRPNVETKIPSRVARRMVEFTGLGMFGSRGHCDSVAL